MIAPEAFPIDRGDVVCFVGGGGKTSLLYGCGRALARSGLRVLSTTTTRVELPPTGMSDAWDWDVDLGALLSRLEGLFARDRHVTVGRRGPYPDRFVAVSDEFISAVAASGEVDVVLVEGDGARQRHLKAPKAGEPVAPSRTTLYVPVLGLDVIGKPLTDEVVHRAEIAAALAGVPIGASIDATIVSRILLHPSGMIREAPPSARIVPFLSHVETDEALDAARRVAMDARSCERFAIRRVLVGNAATLSVREVL